MKLKMKLSVMMIIAPSDRLKTLPCAGFTPSRPLFSRSTCRHCRSAILMLLPAHNIRALDCDRLWHHIVSRCEPSWPNRGAARPKKYISSRGVSPSVSSYYPSWIAQQVGIARQHLIRKRQVGRHSVLHVRAMHCQRCTILEYPVWLH